jgi:hypothetical protein
MRKFGYVLVVVFFASIFTACDSKEVDITGDWEIDVVEISGYPEEEEILFKQLETSLKGGKITIYADGRIDTYSNINGEESVVTKKYDYSDKSNFCILEEDNSKNCLSIKEWTNDKMVAETKDNELTIKMVFIKK